MNNAAEAPAIEIAGLAKRFPNGIQALSGVDLSVAPGSFVVVLGQSGAGKSTLLRCVNALETPDRGRVTVRGRAVTAATARAVRREVGMVFQGFNLVGRLNVMANVLCGRLGKRSTLASLFYLMRRQDVAIAEAALARVGLVDRAWERADRLSGGQRQWVGIARALAQRPAVILADEPVASLDPATGAQIMELLRDIQRADGITLLVSLHQVAFARRFAERVVGLREGRIVFDGAPDDLDDAALEAIYGGVPAEDGAGGADAAALLADG